MNRAAARPRPVVPAVAIVTTDELVGPEAAKYLDGAYQLQMLQTWEELQAALQEISLDAILLDLDTLGESSDVGVAAMRELRSNHPDLVLVAMTRSNSRHLRWKAMEATADEYFVAPIEFQEVQIILARALEKRLAEIEYRSRKDKEVPQASFCGLIGLSEPMQRVYEAIRRVAGSTSTVLIRGESGTGKELVARAIVSMSPRAEKPFISLNCAALPDNLIEAELFGHEKGAFTDARNSRAGHIEMADGGTLFLDEIATLGLPLQSKLLRVLEDRAVQRIGGKSPKKIDFRLVTATNEALEEMVEAGRFREDLYYRIHVVPIMLPALRERQGDIPLLVDHFLRRYCAANGVELKRVDPEVMAILEEDSWPGNVRELENLVQRLVLMVDGLVIKVNHLPQRLLFNNTASQESLLIPEGGVNFDQEIARIEVAYLNAALRRSEGSKIAAARLLQMDKQKMHYLCRKYGVGRD
ncbi:MAG TPA: sigma-54 dependent transcriptional regulator [Terriglobales bacterium]|jgi:DNA-binding NtrC family response regulator|nr:sigma-54 dependent transcriptional regulator [Terriglobales bacterium]